jgi:hypothetical protein
MKKISIFIGVFILSFNCCKKDNLSNASKQKTNSSDTTVINYDYSYINHYRNDFDINKYNKIAENKYSIIYAVSNYMTDNEVAKLSSNIDTVIIRICAYLNTSIAKEYSGFKGKVTYFIEPGIIPRSYQGSPIPIVSITKDNSLLSMYAHETVHNFSMNTYSLWLIEGLAVNLADTLGVEELWPNYSKDLHVYAKYFINDNEAINYIGVSGFFWVNPTTGTGQAFYSLSGSFVKYLIQNMGKSNFMKCYSSPDFYSSIYISTQKSFDVWKNEWLKFLGTLQ